MKDPILKYGSYYNASMMEMCDLLSRAGRPTTFTLPFDWHHYTRVLQFQVQMVKKYAAWTIDDVDGIVGPKTWAALRSLGKSDEEPSNTAPTPSAMPSVDMDRYSPNYSDRGATISHIVLHNTAGAFQGSVDWLCNPQAQASAHLVISRLGQTAQLVPFSKKAWHAGNARMNANSIGIEVEATVSQRGMTAPQEARVIEWVKWLMSKYDIPAENVGIHRWYRNTSCPGLIWPTDDEFRLWRKAHLGG